MVNGEKISSADTEPGHINQMTYGIEKRRTPLLVQMDKLRKAIFMLVLAMMAALFVFSLALRNMPLSELMLFLISLAVASAPEGLLANKGIWLVNGVLLALQLAIVYLPFMQMLFGTEAIPAHYWGIIMATGAVMFLIVEIEKPLT
jgi:magnesium-transporting ATPase (P-type)